MRKIVKIKPVSFSVTELEISPVVVTLNNSANINCRLFNDEISKFFNLELTSEEYSKWGSNDDYITDLVLSKLGLEKSN
jgi:hypothetical protein